MHQESNHLVLQQLLIKTTFQLCIAKLFLLMFNACQPFSCMCGIQRLVNFEGYYLDGADAHSPKEPVYQTHRVEDLEAEAKYTENRTMVRLSTRLQIK